MIHSNNQNHIYRSLCTDFVFNPIFEDSLSNSWGFIWVYSLGSHIKFASCHQASVWAEIAYLVQFYDWKATSLLSKQYWYSNLLIKNKYVLNVLIWLLFIIIVYVYPKSPDIFYAPPAIVSIHNTCKTCIVVSMYMHPLVQLFH